MTRGMFIQCVSFGVVLFFGSLVVTLCRIQSGMEARQAMKRKRKENNVNGNKKGSESGSKKKKRNVRIRCGWGKEEEI